jgi:hypothetical protein
MAFNHLVKPLSRFLRAGTPTSPAPEDGHAASDAASPERVAARAMGEGDEALREAAILRLPDGEDLRRLAGLQGDRPSVSPTLEQAARQRLAQLIDAGELDFAGFLVSTDNADAVLVVAGQCDHSEYLAEALASINDPRRVAGLVIHGTTSRIRQLAAQRIEDPAQLKELLNQLRGKDKSAYKIIKHKCDVLHAEEQRIAQIKIDIDAAYASLERHSHRVHDAVYEPTFEHFAARWRSLEPQAAPELLERARQAIEHCQEIIAEHARKLAHKAAEESRQAAAQAAREAAIAAGALEAERRNEALAQAAAEAAQKAETEEKARAEKLAAEAAAVRKLRGLLGGANVALREGNTARAAGLRRAIETKLPTMPAVPAHLAGQVQQLNAKLTELKEWKDYAVAPKRAELIEQMQSLIGSQEKPRALAVRIKQLQEDWKLVSKGIVSDSEADWQRFHEAAQTAYQPCREYFEAQSQLRQANAEKRKSVLERVRVFESAQSGEDVDWRAVATVLREAPQEWHRHMPVDRAANREAQEAFDGTLARLQARLDAWYAQNVAKKRSLIQRAQHLSGKAEGQEAVDGVKRLQQLWKDVGPVQRDQEQQLWSEFRAQCDAVFQKRQQAHVDYTAGLEANRKQAIALCEEAELTASLSGPALIEGLAKAPQWRTAFEALGELPRGGERAIRDRFERALKSFQSKISQHRASEKRHSITQLFEAARLIQAYGWAVAQAAAAADRDSLQHAAEAFIAGVPQWPKGGLAALKDAWVKAHAATELDVAARETALRTLCIRREILTGAATPPEDQTLRRDFQMQRLVERMGQARDASADEAESLTLEWIRMGPVSPATYDSLRARFVRDGAT